MSFIPPVSGTIGPLGMNVKQNLTKILKKDNNAPFPFRIFVLDPEG
jgi:hypothetical protein